jgi:hypothetical protein
MGKAKWIVQLNWGDRVDIIFSHLCLSVTNIKKTAAPSDLIYTEEMRPS